MQSPLKLVLLPVSMAVVLMSGQSAGDLPRDQSALFSGSGNCASCHTPDAQDPAALRGADGSDVSPPSFWRGTMMANAAKDPLWQAKVSAEVAANPSLAEAIEDKCSTCHAPMGRTEAREEGRLYSLAEMNADPLALDGVSCTVCHQIDPDNLGQDESFSGGYAIGHDQTIYGPYTEPFGWPMLAMSGYEPVFGEHMGSSELCATCHTLFTDSVDETGQVTGRLPEQTPYLEWLNSSYPGEDIQCQTCHMPVESAPVPIANTPRGLDARAPFYRHEFVGGNAFMLSVLRDNAEELGVTAETVHFDSTIARTRRMLASSATVTAEPIWDGDTLEVAVSVQNWSGHKLPTGYPSRRVWLEVKLQRPSGETVFHSGAWNASGSLLAGEGGLEPHRDVIRSENQVQIYESVLGTPSGDVTYGLLRASQYLKDNRIPPVGWKADGPRGEDAAVEGRATSDGNFNRGAIGEGSGSDRVTYRIPAGDGGYLLEVNLLYQSVRPNYVADLFGYDTEAVDRFERMYEATENAPERIASTAVEVGASVSTDGPGLPKLPANLQVYPNPAADGVWINSDRRDAQVVVFDLLGRRVRTLSGVHWDLTDTAGSRVSPGLYLVVQEPQSAGTHSAPGTWPRSATVTVLR
ncbi:MAG: hypothetical protein HKN29_13260 [Rhodothermales bacterium]|nr:hypothetical protein [Rhodothermales bacterium]